MTVLKASIIFPYYSPIIRQLHIKSYMMKYSNNKQKLNCILYYLSYIYFVHYLIIINNILIIILMTFYIHIHI